MAPERAIPLDQGAGALSQVSRVRLSQRAHARRQLAADVGLEQQLGEAWGAEHLVGHGAGFELSLQRAQPVQGVGPQQPRAVGGPGGRAVQGGDDVPAGRPSLELQHRVFRHLLRCDEFHLTERGDGLELVGGEEAVLAYVDVDALERLAEIAPRVRTGPKRLAHGNGLRAIDQRNRLPFAEAPGNRPAESASLCGGWAQSRSRAKRWWRSA